MCNIYIYMYYVYIICICIIYICICICIVYMYMHYICVYVLYIYIIYIVYIYVLCISIYICTIYICIMYIYLYMYYIYRYIYMYYIYVYYICVCVIFVCVLYILCTLNIYIYVLLRYANTGVRCFWWQLMWLRLQPMLAASCSSPGILQLLWLLRLHWSTASLRFSKLGSRLCLPENISLTHGARAVIRWIYRKHLTIVVHIAVVQHCSYLWSLHLAWCFAIPSLTIDIILHGRWSREHLETQDARTR